MAMAVQTTDNGKKQDASERIVTYVPLGGKNSVDLSIGMVRKFLCTPTKNGNHPADQDIVKFMMLCKARELDPWVGDAYLTGYDTQDGPQFSLITAAQALLKRAEISPEYDGMESGVIVKKGDAIEYREGDLVIEGETLLGGWAKCYRKDRSKPSYDALKFSTYNTDRSRWKKDPAGMIVKCAESSVLRKSFPTQLGGLFTREEMDHLSQGRIEAREVGSVAGAIRSAASLGELAERVGPAVTQQKSAEIASEPAKQQMLVAEQSEALAKWLRHIEAIGDLQSLDAVLAELGDGGLTQAEEKIASDAINAKRKTFSGKAAK